MYRNIIYLITLLTLFIWQCSPVTTGPVRGLKVKSAAPPVVSSAHTKTDTNSFDTETHDASLPLPPAINSHEARISTLKKARRDLEAFRLFAKHLRMHGENGDLKLLEEASGEYLNERVNPLLIVKPASRNLETIRLFAELHYLKVLLFRECNNTVKTCEALRDLKNRFSQYMDITIDDFESGYITISSIMEHSAAMCGTAGIHIIDTSRSKQKNTSGGNR